MNRRFLFVLSFFTICYLLFVILGFAQTPTPTTSSIYNVFGSGDNDHDGRADDLIVSTTVNANPVKTSLSQTASAGQKAIFIGGASGFSQKDEVAIIQMTGANAGTWETAFVTDTRPKGRLLLNRPLTNTYNVDSSSKAQVVRIPHYRNVRVQSGGVLTVDSWDGTSGGVMFLRVQNSLDVRNNGKIDVSSKGFRGGQQPADTACGSFFCSAGTQCDVQAGSDGVPMYSCIPSSTTQQLSSEGPSGSGGQQGERGNDGWPGGYTDNKVSASSEVYHGDGGGGGGAGGGGSGGSLMLGATAGADGTSGDYGTRVTSNCSGQGTPTTSNYYTGEAILSYSWSVGSCTNVCQKFQTNGELLKSEDYGSCSGYYFKQYGPPGRGRAGGNGGASNTAATFSGSNVFLGIGGGSGGAGGTGGRGGFWGAAGGQNGSGGTGGNGGGAILLFAKTISISGEIISNGGVGQNGQNGQNGKNGIRDGDSYPGGGGGGAGGAGGGGGSGGTIRFYSESISLGNNLTKSVGGIGGFGGSGGGGGSGTTLDPNSGDSLSSGGTGAVATTTRGGSGSKGAVFATYTNSFSGTSTALVSATQVSEIMKQ